MATTKKPARVKKSTASAAASEASDNGESSKPAQAAWPFPKFPGSGGTVETITVAGADVTADRLSVTIPEIQGERIRVDAINLYTDPAKNQVERIAVEQLIESPFNPRKRYDEGALNDLAETIRGVGVMQSILVRPVDYADIRHGGTRVQAYEIVFGHRRYRAAKIAGEAVVPAIVRELTDSQSAQLQAIENVQRKDLDALDEALGYQNYCKAHGVTKDQLAAEIGLSRTHVYARLKLLTAVPSVQKACQEGDIPSEVALFIARLHTPKLQEKALASLKSNHHDLTDGGKKSVRRIREFLRERFTLRLSEAIFDTKDAELLAGADACTACPKRTGNAPEYQDLTENRKTGEWSGTVQGQPNLCTDPDCFEAKKKAHLKNKQAALESKGKTVIAGGKARTAISAQGEIKGGYIALKDVKALLAKTAGGKGKKAEPIDIPIVVIQDPRNGKTHEVVSEDALKAAGVKFKAKSASQPRGGGYDYQAVQRRHAEERKEAEERAATDTKVNCAILSAVRAAAAAAPRSAFDLQMVALVAFSGVGYHDKGFLATLHGFKGADQLAKKIGQMTVEQLTALMLDCALVGNVQSNGYRDEKPDALLKAAKHYGIDVAEIRKDVSAKAADTKTQDLLQVAEPVDENEEASA